MPITEALALLNEEAAVTARYLKQLSDRFQVPGLPSRRCSDACALRLRERTSTWTPSRRRRPSCAISFCTITSPISWIWTSCS